MDGDGKVSLSRRSELVGATGCFFGFASLANLKRFRLPYLLSFFVFVVWFVKRLVVCVI